MFGVTGQEESELHKSELTVKPQSLLSMVTVILQSSS